MTNRSIKTDLSTLTKYHYYYCRILIIVIYYILRGVFDSNFLFYIGLIRLRVKNKCIN